MAWSDVERRIEPLKTFPDSKQWARVCDAPMNDRRQISIARCEPPDGTRLGPPFPEDPSAPLLPCAALAHALEDTCKPVDGVDIPRPEFPQDSLVGLTLHIPYPTYAAYFYLGRAQVRRALGEDFGDRIDDDHERACAVPTSRSGGLGPMNANR